MPFVLIQYLVCLFLLLDTCRPYYFVRFPSQKWTPHGTRAHREPIAPWRLQLDWRKQLAPRTRRHDGGHLSNVRSGERLADAATVLVFEKVFPGICNENYKFV